MEGKNKKQVWPKYEEVFKYLVENEIDFVRVGRFVQVWNMDNEKDLALLVQKFKPSLSDGAIQIYYEK